MIKYSAIRIRLPARRHKDDQRQSKQIADYNAGVIADREAIQLR